MQLLRCGSQVSPDRYLTAWVSILSVLIGSLDQHIRPDEMWIQVTQETSQIQKARKARQRAASSD